jgi:putative endonuclease
MNTTSLGSQAEKLVSDHLKGQGYKILATNWRRPSCEIDLVAKKQDVIYFIEVKFRQRPDQGAGLDHITASKLKQMAHAANVWSAENDWRGDSRLVAAAVDFDGSTMSLAEIEEIV